MRPTIAGSGEPAVEDAPSAPSARWALASLSLAMLLSSLGTSIANIGLPTLTEAFSASFQQIQWVVLAYLLAITTLIVSVGRLGDLIGRRRLLLAGIGLFTLASIACATAPSPDQQRIASGLAQPRQRPAHRRRTELQPPGRARHATFREQHVQGHEQIQIGL